MAVIKPLLKILFLTLSFASVQAQVEQIQQSRAAYAQGVEAYKKQDYQNAGQHFNQALALRPYHPGLIYTAASVSALNNQKKVALRLLSQLAEMGLSYPAQKDDDFAILQDDEHFSRITAKFVRNQDEIAKGSIAFSLPEKDLITECVAVDSKTNSFFISSVHHRKIVRYNNGESSNFASGLNLWSVFALRVDADSRTLWASTSVTPQMREYDVQKAGQAAVLEYDLDSGHLRNRFVLEEPGIDHWFGDLILHSSGDIFISDSKANAIYLLRPARAQFETFIKPGHFASLQGITFSDDEKYLYAADYSQKIFVIEMNSRAVAPLQHAKELCSIGIDGLYFYKNSLIATQNGTRPNRVVRIQLGKNPKKAEALTVLEANTPELNDPTLGNIVGNTFYYIANSQWNAVDDKGNVLSQEKLHNPIIRKVLLD